VASGSHFPSGFELSYRAGSYSGEVLCTYLSFPHLRYSEFPARVFQIIFAVMLRLAVVCSNHFKILSASSRAEHARWGLGDHEGDCACFIGRFSVKGIDCHGTVLSSSSMRALVLVTKETELALAIDSNRCIPPSPSYQPWAVRGLSWLGLTSNHAVKRRRLAKPLCSPSNCSRSYVLGWDIIPRASQRQSEGVLAGICKMINGWRISLRPKLCSFPPDASLSFLFSYLRVFLTRYDQHTLHAEVPVKVKGNSCVLHGIFLVSLFVHCYPRTTC
jgi:hypothetical protein